VSATPRLCRIPADSASSARGVAHAAITVRFSPPFRAVWLAPLSSVCGVGQAVSLATCSNPACRFVPSGITPVALMFGLDRPPFGVFGVGHAASIATSFNGLAFFPCWLLLPSFQSRAAHVGHAARFA